MTERSPQRGLMYTAKLDADKINPHLEDFSKPEDSLKRPPYGGEDSLLLEGERLWMYAIPSQQRIQIRVNDVGSWYEPSTESLVCRYLEEEGVFDPGIAPGEVEDPGTLESLWSRIQQGLTELSEDDKDLLERGETLATDPETYYQELGELCYRNR